MILLEKPVLSENNYLQTLINNVKLVNIIGIKHKNSHRGNFLSETIYFEKQYSMKNEINNTFQELLRLL